MTKHPLLIVIFFIFYTPGALAIEVGGHLTEDTTWSPENNPYHVTANIYVEQGVTLTIQPGTQVLLNSAELVYDNLLDSFRLFGEESVAKMFWVDGRIVAEGTEDDPIIFTRAQDSLYYHWGTIYLTEQSGLSVFKHCHIGYASKIIFDLMFHLTGAIYMRNGIAIIENCRFLDNIMSIRCVVSSYEILIKNNHFDSFEGFHDSVHLFNIYYYIKIGSGPNPEKPILVAGNQFVDHQGLDMCWFPTLVINNYFNETAGNGITFSGTESPSYIYNNNFFNCSDGVNGYNDDDTDSLYIKNNEFIGGSRGINIDDVYVEVADNIFDHCLVAVYHSPNSMVCNNVIKNYLGTGYSGNVSIFENNIIYNCGEGMSGYPKEVFRNNLIMSNEHVFDANIRDSTVHENNVIIGNEELFYHPPDIDGNPIFRNCILDFELPEECIDGGGNIWVDSLMIDDLFADWQNGDFHLTPGSLAIDAGFDTTDYYPYLDPDDNLRVWDGDNDGQAIIDIGPYEYGAPASGGIHGTIFQTEGGDPVDYVFLKINNQSGEFEFADSSGYYEFLLPPGVYDIYASRVFYDNVVVEGIEVVQGEFTEINFWMESTLGIEDNTRQPVIVSDLVAHQNYPNPFNPTTTIAFDLPISSNVELTIFNIAGQKVKTLLDEYRKAGSHELTWNGVSATGQAVASGIYFYRLKAGGETATGKMLLLK